MLSLCLLLLFSFTLSYAHQEMLYTSSVSYCSPPSAILIQQFDISYIARNDSIVFNVTVASVEPNLTVSGNIGLNVYGMRPVNVTIDFCKVLGNILCPLPQYNFSGADSLSLPSALNVSSRVPEIAYKVPDLEGFAQATLVDTNTGEVKACVQTTLSNGRSTRQPAVSLTTGIIVLIALLHALFWTFRPDPRNAAFRQLLDIIYLYQYIAFTGLLNLNYPLTYISYTLNFAWSLGLFAGSTHIQNSIDSLRNSTGGHVDGAKNPIGSTNRALSPYNVKREIEFRAVSFVNSAPQVTNPATVTSAKDALPAGIATYTNYLKVAQENAFLSIFFTLLMLLAIGFAIIVATRTIAYLLRMKNELRSASLGFIPTSILLSMILASFLPLLTFSFYQWTLRDSWLAVLLSVIATLALLGSVLVFGIRASLHCEEVGPAYGPLQGSYKPSQRWFHWVLLGSLFSKSVIVGFGQANGTVQVALFFTTELAMLSALIIFRPFLYRHTDALQITFAVMRVVSSGLLITFITSLGVKPIPRVVIGLVTAVILSTAVVIAFLDLLKSFVPWGLLRRRLVNNRMDSDYSLKLHSSETPTEETGKQEV